MDRQRVRYSSDVKEEALAFRREGLKRKEVAELLKIKSPSVIWYWERDAGMLKKLGTRKYQELNGSAEAPARKRRKKYTRYEPATPNYPVPSENGVGVGALAKAVEELAKEVTRLGGDPTPILIKLLLKK